MKIAENRTSAEVVYRANVAGGRVAEVRLVIDPTFATVADAWSRLTSAYDDVDPMSLEIEIRQREPRAPAGSEPAIQSRSRPGQSPVLSFAGAISGGTGVQSLQHDQGPGGDAAAV